MQCCSAIHLECSNFVPVSTIRATKQRNRDSLKITIRLILKNKINVRLKLLKSRAYIQCK